MIVKAVLRLVHNDTSYYEVNLPVSFDGQPILPGWKDSIVIRGRTYVVNHTIWDYKNDKEIKITVIAKD